MCSVCFLNITIYLVHYVYTVTCFSLVSLYNILYRYQSEHNQAVKVYLKGQPESLEFSPDKVKSWLRDSELLNLRRVIY